MLNLIYEGLYISSRNILNYPELVQKAGIRAVVRLDFAGEYLKQWGAAFSVLYLPYADGTPVPGAYFHRVAAFIWQHHQQNQAVLVHDHGGISRSPTMVMAYLIEYQGMSLAEAYRLLKAKRPMIKPHPVNIDSLVKHYHLPYTDAHQPDFLDTLLETNIGG